MKVTTLRLPEGLYDDLVEEAESGDRSFSEYVRILLRNRKEHTNTPEHTQPTTPEYARLRERVSALEDRVGELESGDGAGQNLNQQDAGPAGDVLVNDDSAAEQPPSPGTNPHSQTVNKAVQWAIDNEPVRRAEIIGRFEDDVDILGDSLWKKHIRDALKEAGFTHDRTGGVATWQR